MRVRRFHPANIPRAPKRGIWQGARLGLVEPGGGVDHGLEGSNPYSSSGSTNSDITLPVTSSCQKF